MDTGFYFTPTLLAGCGPDNPAVQQEFFGPVVVVVPVDDEDEAVAVANGTEFGLYDYVFSADTARAMRVAQQLPTGNDRINTATTTPHAPLGALILTAHGRPRGRP